MKHRIDKPGFICVTNDINPKCYCNYTCDIRQLLNGNKPGFNLFDYDCFIFTPPCNYYSRANYRRETSIVAQTTKDILPLCLDWCVYAGNKPFLVENVNNSRLLKDLYPEYQFSIGGHTYWSNILTKADFNKSEFVKNQNKNFVAPSKRNLNSNVHLVIYRFLDKVRLYYETIR